MKKCLFSFFLAFVMAFTMPAYLLAGEAAENQLFTENESDEVAEEDSETLSEGSELIQENGAEQETEMPKDQDQKDGPAEEEEPVSEEDTEAPPSENETESEDLEDGGEEEEELTVGDLTEEESGDEALERKVPVIHAKKPKRSDDPSIKYEDEEELDTGSAGAYMAGNAQVLEEAVSGSIAGTNITWMLDTDGLLTITGSGEFITGADAEENSLSGGRPFSQYADYIQKAVIGNGITTVGDAAFADCQFITEVTLPEGITEIGGWAFYSCRRLETINLPSTLKNIKFRAFEGTYLLKEIRLPQRLISIGSCAFQYSGLTEIDIPDSVTELGEGAFWGCSAMTSCTLGDGITVIPEDAFIDCHALEKVDFPENVSEIGNGAFCRCYHLTGTLTIPDSVQVIETYAFQATAFSVVVFGNNLKSIGNYILNTGSSSSQGAVSPSAIKFTGDFPSISANSFYDVTAVAEYPENNSTWTEEGLQNYGGSLTWRVHTDDYYASGVTDNGISWYIDWNTTLYINGSGRMDDFSYSDTPWYKDRKVIQKVVVGDGITRIGSYAFYYCSRMKEIQIPQSVTEIGGSAFYECSSLKEISLPNNLTVIENYAFSGCRSFTEISLPSQIKSIESSLFYGCSSLKNVSLSVNTETIQRGAFRYCSSLSSIHIGRNISFIGDSAFDGCSGLSEITVDSGNTSFSTVNGLLFNKEATTLILAPKTITAVVLPGTLTQISAYAFSDCMELMEIDVPSGVIGIGSDAFRNCGKLERVSLGQNLTELSSNLFYGCGKLTDITIPDSVKKIGSYVFYGCNLLTSFYIPKGAVSIDSGAFNSCRNLRTIEVDTANPAFKSADGCLFSKDGKALVRFPEGKYGEYYLPETVNTISEFAFYQAALVSRIVIPESVSSIGRYGLGYCQGLIEIDFLGDAPSFASYSCYASEADVYYPAGNNTWTAVINNNYGGTLNWIEYTDLEKDRLQGVQLLTDTLENGETEQLEESYIDYTRVSTCVRQFASEQAGGIYFLLGKKLKFLDLATGKSRLVYSFPANSTYIYETEGKLYWSYEGQVIIYDLDAGRLDDSFSIPGASSTGGIGVDGQGRIYIGVYEGGRYFLNLYSTDCILLDQLQLEGKVYSFTGCGSDGEIFFEANRNWRYWGYDHSMHAIFAAKVADNKFSPISGTYLASVMFDECQEYYHEHQNSAELLNGNLLVDKAGRVYDIAGGYDAYRSIASISREDDEELPNDDYDTLSSSPRMVYNSFLYNSNHRG